MTLNHVRTDSGAALGLLRLLLIWVSAPAVRFSSQSVTNATTNNNNNNTITTDNMGAVVGRRWRPVPTAGGTRAHCAEGAIGRQQSCHSEGLEGETDN